MAELSQNWNLAWDLSQDLEQVLMDITLIVLPNPHNIRHLFWRYVRRGNGPTRDSGVWEGASSDKQEVRHNRDLEVTRATSEKGGGWEVRNYRGGVETYDGIPPLAERLQLDPNNGYVSIYWRGFTDKGIGFTLAYWTWDWMWWQSKVICITDQTRGGSVL